MNANFNFVCLDTWSLPFSAALVAGCRAQAVAPPERWRRHMLTIPQRTDRPRWRRQHAARPIARQGLVAAPFGIERVLGPLPRP